MKMATIRLNRAVWAPLGALAVAGLLTGCGDKSSDPDAVTVDELKYPGGLTIWDKGNGSVTLQWSGSNNEDDFDGYNVYGVKNTAAGLSLTESEAIKLLDDKGEAIQTARDTLAKFNYDPAKGLGLAAPMNLQDESTTTAAEKEEEPEFSALPIHSVEGEDKMLPTCQQKTVGGANVCAKTTKTAGSFGKTVSDDTSLAVNGTLTYDVTGLEVGQSYCFVVLSSMDGGKKVSQTSSNLACIVPQYVTSTKLPLGSTFQVFKLGEWIKACTATAGAAKCSDPATPYITAADTTAVSVGGNHTAGSPGPLYIEGSTFVAGKGTGIFDVGYYENGLSDKTLPAVPPTFVIDSKEYGATNKGPVFNERGYSIAGQSIPILQGHVYVIATPATDDTATPPTKFHYVWIYVSGAVSGSEVAVDVMAPKDVK